MKESYRKLLDKAYEIEGLLLFAIDRGELPPRIDELLKTKTKELLDGIFSLKEPELSPIPQDDEESELPQPPVDFEEETALFAVPQDDEEPGLPEPPVDFEEETALFAVPQDEEETALPQPPVEDEDEPAVQEITEEDELDADEEPDEEFVDEDEEDDEEFGFYSLDDEDDEPIRPVKPAQHIQNKPLPKFSLNDKFLFIREFFNGNPAEFNAAIGRLSEFNNAEEAEEYFIEKYSINPDTDTGTVFLSMIQSYYKS